MLASQISVYLLIGLSHSMKEILIILLKYPIALMTLSSHLQSQLNLEIDLQMVNTEC
jgi:hypothetical protein